MKDIFNLSLLQNMIRTATPLVLAALGGLLTMQAGILNIGMEGMILLGAFFAVVGSYFFGSSAMGVALAVCSGILIGLLFGVFVIELKSDEFVIGVAINILGSGLTVFLLRTIFGVKGAFSSPKIIPLPDINIDFLSKVPFLDAIFNNHSIFVYISWILVIVVYIFLFKTPMGYWIRAAGESPQSLETAGINPKRMKYISSVLCGILCGFAGAHLSLGYLTLFTENMSANKGFIALSVIIFGASHPIKAFFAALLFGFFDALGIRLQSVGIPSQFTQMIPYIATIIVLFIVAQKTLQRRKHSEI
ncbi:ABC transporter permease [Alkaliphilus oremlandii]|uniref:Inner-membrane translocator n=1 Tax=Alkaliphilus oremlandii (strain OhILAs) TaxID=350688 RepID=A8MJC7_ALKOO|nr:ABC transporter permease [Alkaliphilus oremlandii]ABW19909.1 inner-membrane translocator [Alkaliphilus oremlandii OhILAs]